MLVKRNSKGQTPISKIKRNNRAYTNKAEIADQFNKHFFNVGQNLAKRIENCDGSPTQFIRSTPVASFVMSIARNSGHFAPVINCQRNLISKMADKNDGSQGKRIPCDFLNNLSSVDLFYEEKSWNETPCKKMLGLYSAERLTATKQYAAVPFVTFS